MDKPTQKRVALYLPSHYKNRTNAVTAGQAKSGEISPKGLMTETEDWEGRVKVLARPTTIHLKMNPDGTIRPKTMAELIEEGKFFIGKGPSDFLPTTQGAA